MNLDGRHMLALYLAGKVALFSTSALVAGRPVNSLSARSRVGHFAIGVETA